jgi:hypothetical protein
LTTHIVAVLAASLGEHCDCAADIRTSENDHQLTWLCKVRPTKYGLSADMAQRLRDALGFAPV